MLDSKYLPKMKGLSTVELLDITTQRREEYEVEALLCAEFEIRNRQLTEDESLKAKAALQEIVESRLQKKERIRKLERGVYEAVSVLNPLVSRSALMTIRIISVLFLLSYVWLIWGSTDLIMHILRTFPRWSYGDKIFLLQIFWIPIATFGFFRLKKYGWKMFNAYAVLSSGFAIALVISKVRTYFEYGGEDEEFYGQTFGHLRDLFPEERSFPLDTIFTTIIWILFVVYLNFPKTRKIYSITRKEHLWTFIVPILLMVYLTMYIYLF